MTEPRAGINKRVADRLYAERKLEEVDYLHAIDHARRKGLRVEEALIELSLIAEAELLKFVATLHKTQFVSTERMSKAKLDREAMRVVPKGLARHHGVFPLVLDRKNDKLIIATADPDNAQAIHELQMGAAVTRVVPMVARPAAVQAAIDRGYDNDRTRFQHLLQPRVQEFEQMLQGEGPDRRIGEPVSSAGRRSGLAQPSSQEASSLSLELPVAPGDYLEESTPESQARRPTPAPPRPGAAGASQPGPANGPPLRSAVPKRRSSMFSRPVLGFTSLGEEDAPELEPAKIAVSQVYLESVRVLVALLENERGELRGHSSVVARLVADICERINLPADQTKMIVLGSYLHDLGKMGTSHLTALNVAEHPEHHTLAHKLLRLPGQLMESVALPDMVLKTTRHMYERVGGGGIPDGLQGKDIPIGARILAVADSYAELTRNAEGPRGGMLSSDEAIEVLRAQSGVVFDGNIINMLEKACGGEKIVTDLLANRHRVLVVDPDPEETMVLQLRLVEQGFDVHVARSGTEAEKALAARPFALVVCEVDLELEGAGFTLREQTRQSGLSWVFLSSRDSRAIAERALELGVDDFVPKPVSHEILVAKLSRLVTSKSERVAPRGVAGSLSQMGLPEIIQILWHGRKTCALHLASGERSGEIHFSQGRIVDALWGEATGETAFYRMLALGEEGEFAVDPEFLPSAEPRIEASPEGLLLEGMRLLDEGQIP